MVRCGARKRGHLVGWEQVSKKKKGAWANEDCLEK